MDASRFAGRLRELREGAGLTQKALGDQAGLSMRAVAQWERAVREPSWSSVIAMCKALGVTPNDFLEAPARRKRPGPGRPKSKD
jgi:transcriptional regulator with XRE-family HTH domain